MHKTGAINSSQLRDAEAAPLGLNIQRWNYTVAPYFIEEVRQLLKRDIGPDGWERKRCRSAPIFSLKCRKRGRGLEKRFARR